VSTKNYFTVWHALLLVTLVINASQGFAREDDPLSGTGQLESVQLVEAVLARNPSLSAMQSAWRAAVGRIDQVSALDDPRLSYSVAPETTNDRGQDFGQKIHVSQRLPWPGKLALREEGARFRSQAVRQNIELTRLRLIEATHKTFADWYYIHEAIRINGINQDLWHEFRATAESRYSTGRASKQDALRAEVEQTMLEHQAIVLDRKKRNIQAQINTLLNRSPVHVVTPPAGLPEPGPLPEVQQLREKAMTVHPVLKNLLARKQAQQSRLELARKNYFPDFDVSAGYNTLWNQRSKRFTVGVSVNVPIGLSKRSARVDENQAGVQQIKWQLSDKQAEIAGTVQQTYDSVQESRHVLTLYRDKLLPIAEENLQAAKADYQAGKGNFLDLVSAEKNLITTQLGSVKSLAEYHQRLAMLATTVGIPNLTGGTLTKAVSLQGITQ